jgi:pSer/pThr/pTyr-binding forkhead associated (FHA) protein
MGSFIWVDHLRVSGVPAAMIRVVGPFAQPYGQFRTLCRNSQIDGGDPLRSNSEARPDNLWGWPGYGLADAWQAVRGGDLGRAARLLWGLLAEPDLATPYVPPAERVYRAVDREARRIGWSAMWRPGVVTWLRKTDDGRYAVAVEGRGPRTGEVRFLVARYLQLSLGYPAIHVLPDVRRRRASAADAAANGHRVVQAYEPHGALYAELEREGGRVLLRGRGVTAARILERLSQVRRVNPSVEVVHLLRGPRDEPARWRNAVRPVTAHRDLQTFNWPKGAWGGEVRRQLATLPPERRDAAVRLLGAPTTPPTPGYLDTVADGVRAGWYSIEVGEVDALRRGDAATVVAELADGRRLAVAAVVDATGLRPGATGHPLIRDLGARYGVLTNALGGLTVEPESFELAPLRNGPGRVYLAGVLAAGGAFAPVDSFLGLQVAALASVDSLHRAGAPSLAPLAPLRSLAGWLRWARGRAP